MRVEGPTFRNRYCQKSGHDVEGFVIDQAAPEKPFSIAGIRDSVAPCKDRAVSQSGKGRAQQSGVTSPFLSPSLRWNGLFPGAKAFPTPHAASLNIPEQTPFVDELVTNKEALQLFSDDGY